MQAEVKQYDELTAIKKRQVELKRARIEQMRKYGLPFYRPHPKQDLFHKADAKFRGVFAGNRFGKSQVGVAEDCAWIQGERPWYPQGSPERTLGIPQNRPVKGLIIATDWDKCKEIFTDESALNPGKIWKNLPRESVKHKNRNHQGAIDYLEFKNGAVLRFDTVQSFKNNPLGSESSDWDFIHIDEPIPEAMWKAVSRGLVDRNGRAWFTLTALTEPWILEMFFPKQKERKNLQQHSVVDDNGKLRKWAITGSIYDNIYLPREAIDEFEATLTDDEKQCRLYGMGLYLSGVVYKEFDMGVHVMQNIPKGWTSYNRPPKDYTLHYAIDPHPKTPHAVLFCWADPFGHLFFCEEIFHHCLIPDLCELICEVKKQYPSVGLEICDPSAWIENPIDGGTMADVFHQYGLFVEPGPKDVVGGILSCKRAFKTKNRVNISPLCDVFQRELLGYAWDPKSEKRDKPIDKNDHLIENFHRLILSDPQFIGNQNYDLDARDDTFERADLSEIEV